MILPKIVAVIPARWGSTRVKQKNIRDIQGQPMIAYSILDALRAKSIDKVFVSTDSKRIARISEKFGADVPFIRPKNIAQSDSVDLEWVLHFLKWYVDEHKHFPDYIVHVRPTSPIRTPSVLDDAINKIKLYSDATSLRSIEEVGESPYKFFAKEKEYLYPYIETNKYNGEYYNLPNQMFPPAYKPNGYVDILKSRTIINKSLHGHKILSFMTPMSPEIDTEKDFDFIDYFMKEHLKL